MIRFMGSELKPTSAGAGDPPKGGPAAGPFERRTPTCPRLGLLDRVGEASGWILTHGESTADAVLLRFVPEGQPEAWVEVRGRRDEGSGEVAVDTRGAGESAPADPSMAALRDALRESGWDGPPEALWPTDPETWWAVLSPAMDPDGTLGRGWRLRDVAERPGAGGERGWVLEFRRPDVAHAYHVVVTVPPGDAALRTDGFGITDYMAGPHDRPETAEVRSRVFLALQPVSPPDRSPDSPTSTSAAPPPVVLDAAALAAFERDGYLVLPCAIAPPDVAAALDAVRWFLDLDPTLQDGWYFDIIPYAHKTNLQRAGTFLEFYQHQALWEIRQNPAVYGAFRDLWGREDLWVSLDRVGFKPPRRGTDDLLWQDKGRVHWDVDIAKLPIPFGVQGLVALTDAGEEHGTFRCAPGAHRDLARFVGDGPDADRGRYPGEDTFEMIAVPLHAGDLLVWHSALPHRTGPNDTDDVRLVQYVSMAPARPNAQERLERIRAWRDRLPGGSHFEGDPLRREERHGTTATLSPLGFKLLGVEAW